MYCARLTGNAGCKKSPSGNHCTTLLGYIFTIKACIDNRQKGLKQQYLLHMAAQYGELRPTNGWDRFGSFLEHPSKFPRVSHLGSVTARHSSSGRQPKFAAVNRGRHLYSAGRPWRWALAHILVNIYARACCAWRNNQYILAAESHNKRNMCSSCIHSLSSSKSIIFVC